MKRQNASRFPVGNFSFCASKNWKLLSATYKKIKQLFLLLCSPLHLSYSLTAVCHELKRKNTCLSTKTTNPLSLSLTYSLSLSFCFHSLSLSYTYTNSLTHLSPFSLTLAPYSFFHQLCVGERGANLQEQLSG